MESDEDTQAFVDGLIAEHKRLDEQTRAMARDIVEAQNPVTLDAAKRFAEAWIGTAAQMSRNADYWESRARQAEALNLVHDAIDHLVRVALVRKVAPETVRAAVEHALKQLDDECHDERSQIDRLTTERDDALARAKNYKALRDGMSDQLEARVGDLGRARDLMDATLRALSIPPELAYEPTGRELAVAVQRVADAAARVDRVADLQSQIAAALR